MSNDKDFWIYLDQIIEYTGIGRDEVFDKCYDIYTSIHLSAGDLLQIAVNLKVDPILLWQRRLDLEALKSSRSGSHLLPARYSEVKASKIISLQNVLEQFKRYGLYDNALSRIQINEQTLLSNSSVSILAINDLLLYSSEFFTAKDYHNILSRNASFMVENIVKNEINLRNDPIKIATGVMELISHFEQNWNYKIVKHDLNSIIMETSESEQMLSTKDYRSYTNHITTFGRFSFMHQALGYLNIDAHHITPLSNWDNPNKNFKFSININ